MQKTFREKQMNVIQTDLPGVLILEPVVYGDSRGYFLETYQEQRYKDLGIPSFVQDNLSYSRRGTLRGLHYQIPMQGKLVQVISGTVFDVIVDIRKESSTFGKWIGVELSSNNRKQVWIPKGFAHGFYVLSDAAAFSYKCTDAYVPSGGVCIAWNDPDIGIKWPLEKISCYGHKNPILSEKDEQGIFLKNIKE